MPVQRDIVDSGQGTSIKGEVTVEGTRLGLRRPIVACLAIGACATCLLAIGAAAASANTLLVTKNNDFMGTITSSPPGINCGTSCSSDSANYAPGTQVTLTANGDRYWQLNQWTGNCSGSNETCTVTMSDNRWVNANFGCTPTTVADTPYDVLTADTYAAEATPTVPQGDNGHVRVGYTNADGNRWYTYIKGAVPDVPQGCTPYDAAVVLPNGVVGPSGTLTFWVRPVQPSSWTEANLTWNNRPSGTGTGYNANPRGYAGNPTGCCSAKVDPQDLQDLYASGQSNYSFMVRPAGPCGQFHPDLDCSPSIYNGAYPGYSWTMSSKEGDSPGGLVVAWH